MRIVLSANSLRIGDFVSFVYDGGSTPGIRRIIFVTDVDIDRLHGYDFARENYRQFIFDKCSDIIILSAEEAAVLVPSVQLARGFQDLYQD